ncbi:MAG: hypothetical protein KAW12_01325 [Candidatus Aminicenantes bacterium]|nr:hypothetical protein [Candidatus Aminicenantes bacterium]
MNNRTLHLIFVTVLVLSLTLQAAALQVKVIKERTDLLEKPDSNSKVLMQVHKGTLLEVKEEPDNWYRVLLPHKIPGDPPVEYGYVSRRDVQLVTTAEKKQEKKDRIFLMGLGMLRLNWTSVKGSDIRFRYSDLGLPTELSTRERASFMVDGTLGHGRYTINGHLNYDPENRITEPPLEFLFNVGNEKTYLSAGDYRMGVMLDSVFSRYYHPFRGGLLGVRTERFGVEVLAGLSRGESGIEELFADAGAGPYYLGDSPIIRGSEVVFLVSRSATNPDLEIKRQPLVRNRDYFIDYDRGSLLFSYPLYSYDEMGNPVSILISYQFESLAGSFSRAVMGLRAFLSPIEPVRLTFSYIADADKNQDIGDIFKNRRGIYSFGLNIDSKPLTFFGEFSTSSDPAAGSRTAYFGGGILTILPKLKFFFNGWKLDSEFPTFANRQLDFGYSLFQVFPSYAERNVFLSPFQFSRNLGAELYPFSLARLSIDEKEIHGFLEWEDKVNRFSLGTGTRRESSTGLQTDTVYTSAFHNGESTKAWGKIGREWGYDRDKTGKDARVDDLLLGVRQRVKRLSKGEVFVQVDFRSDWAADFLDLNSDLRRQTYSLLAEYLTGTEGYFAAYRKETVFNRDEDRGILDADIYEVGIRRHVYKGLFLDSRFRREESSADDGGAKNSILSLGGGIETKKFRGMARYEVQVNRRQENEGRRRLWSVYLFGTPLKRMSISLRYYRQLGREENKIPAPFSLDERSEEQLSFRFLWRPRDFLNFYSQWRYDTNLELYPPLDRTRSNALAAVHGVKVMFTKRFEFLANYKLLKVWGPIENRKYAAAAELGYLLLRHFRIGVGMELIDFEDIYNSAEDYRSTVGYFKLVAIF